MRPPPRRPQAQRSRRTSAVSRPCAVAAERSPGRRAAGGAVRASRAGSAGLEAGPGRAITNTKFFGVSVPVGYRFGVCGPACDRWSRKQWERNAVPDLDNPFHQSREGGIAAHVADVAVAAREADLGIAVDAKPVPVFVEYELWWRHDVQALGDPD